MYHKIDHTPFIKEFESRHGKGFLHPSGWLFYESGASREPGSSSRLEPPSGRGQEGEYQLALAKLKYWEAKLEDAKRRFAEEDERLKYHAPHDPERELVKLKELRDEVTEIRKDCKAAEKALHNTEWGRARKARREEEAAERARREAFHQARTAIRI